MQALVVRKLYMPHMQYSKHCNYIPVQFKHLDIAFLFRCNVFTSSYGIIRNFTPPPPLLPSSFPLPPSHPHSIGVSYSRTSLTPPGAQLRGVWGLVPVGKRRGHCTRGWLCRWKGRCMMLQGSSFQGSALLAQSRGTECEC